MKEEKRYNNVIICFFFFSLYAFVQAYCIEFCEMEEEKQSVKKHNLKLRAVLLSFCPCDISVF